MTIGIRLDDQQGEKTMTTAKAKTRDADVPAPTLSQEDLKKVLQLAKASESVELKLSVPATGHRATLDGIGLDPVEAQPRQVFFFDTSDLALNRAGLIVRARRIQGGEADTVIKRRPVDPTTIDPDLKRSKSFKVELDLMPGGYVCSASYKGACTGQDVREVAAGEASIRSLFSKGQRGFYDAHAPAGIEMNSLRILGPIFLLKAKHQPKNFDHNITVEMWFYPDGSRILEVSTKCLPARGVPGHDRVQGLSLGLRHRYWRSPGVEDQVRAGVLQGAIDLMRNAATFIRPERAPR